MMDDEKFQKSLVLSQSMLSQIGEDGQLVDYDVAINAVGMVMASLAFGSGNPDKAMARMREIGLVGIEVLARNLQ